MLVNETVFCEGPSDRKVFSKIYTNVLFLSAGGSNISDTAEAFIEDGKKFYAIVDGDQARKEYAKKIKHLKGDSIVHILLKGTLEDYYDNEDISKTITDNNLTAPTCIEDNFLEKKPFSDLKDKDERKNERQKIKNALQKNCEMDTNILKVELDTFIKKVI